MSIAGLASTALYSILNMNTTQSSQKNGQSNFQQIQSEFQQLGQDLQSGNLSQAQQDFATLQQDMPDPTAFANSNSTNPIVQAFNSLSQDLQSGNLNAAQKDYGTLQQDLQQNANTTQIHHHHRHGGGGEQNQVNQAFSSLAQALQSGNLSGAQSAFATLQQDLENLDPTGLAARSTSTGTSPSTTTGSNLSVTV
jgi:outer membrane protein assembly factor BamD (BamD/ComL family)